MKSPWRLIPHETREGSYNLSFDARLLEKRFPQTVLRFYSWSRRCVSYGYFQNPPLNPKWPAYRRVTGGGTVFHDKDLTYSLIYPRDSYLPWSVRRSYCEIHRVIQEALQSLGIATFQCTEEKRGGFCFTSPVPGDLLYQERKIAGAAQRRMGGHLLHQGSILVEPLGVDRLQLSDAMVEAFGRKYQVTFES